MILAITVIAMILNIAGIGLITLVMLTERQHRMLQDDES